MTETPEFSHTEAPASKPKRGRPRPTEVVDRDEKVLTHVTGEGITRDDVAAQSGLPAVRVYQSLVRLMRAGRIVRVRADGKHLWKLVS